jgi:hypothetical protein
LAAGLEREIDRAWRPILSWAFHRPIQKHNLSKDGELSQLPFVLPILVQNVLIGQVVQIGASFTENAHRVFTWMAAAELLHSYF